MMGDSIYHNRFAKSYIYDSPDGEDCLKKTFHSAKLGAIVGGYFGLVDIFALSKPKGALAVTGRALVFITPAAGAAATFALTSCIIGDFRGKDTALNHGIGAFAGGCVLATRFKNKPMGLGVAFLLGIAGAVLKQVKLAGLHILPENIYPPQQLQAYKFGPQNKRGYQEPTNY